MPDAKTPGCVATPKVPGVRQKGKSMPDVYLSEPQANEPQSTQDDDRPGMPAGGVSLCAEEAREEDGHE